jgi:carbamoyltransferase
LAVDTGEEVTAILGISAFYHDSAAALLVDGDIVAAAQEERFTRKKHDPAFPTNAAQYCLNEAGISKDDLDYVVFYEKPLRKFDRLLETYLGTAPQGLSSFSMALPLWLREKLHLPKQIRKGLNFPAKAKLVFTDHHESHAASAFFPSPFEEAAILTLDGVGEWDTTTIGTGSGNRITLSHHLQFPHSLGLLYSAITYYCGFKVNSGEYKLMGLAPYGKPVYEKAIRDNLMDLKPDGSFRLNMEYFTFHHGLRMTGDAFDKLFGAPARRPESDLLQRHMDLAASVQVVTEDVMLRMATDLHRRTGMKNLVLAGGVALNCVANGKLLRQGTFDRIWIQPAAGDAGGALGAALFTSHQLLDRPRKLAKPDSQKGSFLGPKFSDSEIESMLKAEGVEFERAVSDADLVEQTANVLADGKVVGWFQGRMEFGPRALGARSIIGDARSPSMQATMNLKIKFRESFRPFAPMVLEEYAHEWFDLRPGEESPYMLLVAGVLDRHRTPISQEQLQMMQADPDLRNRVNVARSTVPAVTHVDYSARVQTIDVVRNPRMHALMSKFNDITGCPVLVNTSFNVRGEPIVCTPKDAYRCFMATHMDVLVLENYIVRKTQAALDEQSAKQHLAQFQLD